MSQVRMTGCVRSCSCHKASGSELVVQTGVRGVGWGSSSRYHGAFP